MRARSLVVSLASIAGVLGVALALAGCPDNGQGKGDGTSNVTSGVPASGKITKPTGGSPSSAAPSKVAEDAAFPKATLFEIFRAEQLGDEAQKKAVFQKFGLREGEKENADRVLAYEAALKAFASSRPDEWSALVDEIEAARAKISK